MPFEPTRNRIKPEEIDTTPKRRPPWIRVRAPMGETYQEVQQLMRSKSLHTVCEEAMCPNLGECWGEGTATFLMLGDVCTRSCGFCDLKRGAPSPLDWMEPERIAQAVGQMKLKHAVITSVNRDDRQDGGAVVGVDVRVHPGDEQRWARETERSGAQERDDDDRCRARGAEHPVGQPDGERTEREQAASTQKSLQPLQLAEKQDLSEAETRVSDAEPRDADADPLEQGLIEPDDRPRHRTERDHVEGEHAQHRIGEKRADPHRQDVAESGSLRSFLLLT